MKKNGYLLLLFGAVKNKTIEDRLPVEKQFCCKADYNFNTYSQ
jgi:hypothetical protein